MSEAATVSDIVSMSIGGDAKEVKSAIGDVLQQKITVALENNKKFRSISNCGMARGGGNYFSNFEILC